MANQTYVCRRFKSVGEFEYSADFAQASSGIYVRFEHHDYWQPLPFQVADAKHDRMTAEKMIARYFQ